jgi:hypothetical protein
MLSKTACSGIIDNSGGLQIKPGLYVDAAGKPYPILHMQL